LRNPYCLAIHAILLTCSVFSRPATAARNSADQNPTLPPPASTLESPAISSLRFLAIDKDGNPVTDLRADELQLRVNKTEQKVESLSPAAGEPLTIGLFFDISGSRRADKFIDKEVIAATHFLNSVWHQGDAGFVLLFTYKTYALVQPTNDLSQIELGLRKIADAGYYGPTSLYDAMCSVHVNLQAQSSGDTLFLVFSDFSDNSSRHSKKDTLDYLWSEGVRVVPIVLGNPFGAYDSRSMRRRAEEAANELADQTGGELLKPGSEKDLDPGFQRLTGELKGAYRIRFEYPPNLGKKHKFEVNTTRPHVRLLYAKD
jgi:VWFA-related protein